MVIKRYGTLRNLTNAPRGMYLTPNALYIMCEAHNKKPTKADMKNKEGNLFLFRRPTAAMSSHTNEVQEKFIQEGWLPNGRLC